MSAYLRLPNGDAVSNAIIKSVHLFNGKGVACRDAQTRMVVWVKVDDVEKAERVRDILIRFMTEKQGIAQPDWSFLNEEDVVTE
ncbi:MAG: hypothetical protein PHO76_07750 [Methylotenera sp.]|nr:hypothetical protein [Methylotenera sp.]MDD4924924.1 hypothetical protein [Methylotenera sp.]